MTRYARGVTALLVAVVTVALAGCTGLAPSNPTLSSSNPVALPQVRVPIGCSQLFSAAAASELVGAPVSVKADETTPPTGFDSIAARQRGTLVCTWGGSALAGGDLAGYAHQLEIDIAVDAKVAYEKDVPTLDKDVPPARVNTAGGASTSRCEVTDAFACGAEVLAGTYWVSIELRDLDDTHVSAAIAGSRIQSVMTKVAGALSGSVPAAAWTAPDSNLPALCTARGSRAKLQHILGVAHLKSNPFTQTAANAFYLAETGPGNSSCQWTSASYKNLGAAKFYEVDFSILRGGAWAIPRLAQEQHTDLDYGTGTYRSVHVPGATAAVLSCNIDYCSAILAVDGNAVQIGLEPNVYVDPNGTTKPTAPSAATTVKTLAALVAALDASVPS